MSTLLRLACRQCRKPFPAELLYACDDCFGPLQPVYDLEAAGRTLTAAAVRSRPRNVWRYRELLPLAGEPRTGLFTGCTPLVPAERLAQALGVARCFVKNDAVNHPTCSFKDRVVAMAVEKALELGLDTIGAPSTGNLANAVAAAARPAGLRSCVLIPDDLEAGKVVASAVYGPLVIRVRGNYDHVNRLAGELSSVPGFGMANVNLRPYYAEGSKTIGYEIAEDLGFVLPDDVVVPMGSGSLLTKLAKAFGELVTLGLVRPRPVRFHGAQAAGCAPIAGAFLRGDGEITPVKPKTIARSIAIGDPASGFEALETIRGSSGSAAAVSDEETLLGIRLLAETEGIFTETAGGVTVAAARALVERGAVPRDGTLVLCITGNGLKTIEPLEPLARELPVIQGSVEEVEALLAGRPR